ncbi:MAG: transcriptional regulator [Patescibacteria group bacterium]|jgi:hypothetical protein|nr:transcriptional regulator [Patescibacteria group bacterium]
MIDQLFGSKTRVKLLGLFYQNPNRSFYVREITRKIDEQINSVRRELANLLSIGIISSDTSNNKLYYEVNQDFEHYDSLASMFGGKPRKKLSKKQLKEVSPEETSETSPDVVAIESTQAVPEDEYIQGILKSGNVRTLVYTGQFTRDNMAGVDIVVIGDINLPNLEHAISALEKAEKKDILYSVLTPGDYLYRRQINDRFISNLMLAKKIVHLDKDNLLS